MTFFTAGQLQRMFKADGRIVLPYSGRLTPAAKDWLRLKNVAVGYGPAEIASRADVAAVPQADVQKSALPWLWWMDGPCGAVKAAITEAEKSANVQPIGHSADGRETIEVVRSLSMSIGSGKASGGILAVKASAEATLYTNRCRHLRAVVGTSLAAVESGIRDIAANVLVIEYPAMSMMQIRNILTRFLSGKRVLKEELLRRLESI